MRIFDPHIHIAHHCTLALNPKEANDPRCTPVLDSEPAGPAGATHEGNSILRGGE